MRLRTFVNVNGVREKVRIGDLVDGKIGDLSFIESVVVDIKLESESFIVLAGKGTRMMYVNIPVESMEISGIEHTEYNEKAFHFGHETTINDVIKVCGENGCRGSVVFEPLPEPINDKVDKQTTQQKHKEGMPTRKSTVPKNTSITNNHYIEESGFLEGVVTGVICNELLDDDCDE